MPLQKWSTEPSINIQTEGWARGATVIPKDSMEQSQRFQLHSSRICGLVLPSILKNEWIYTISLKFYSCMVDKYSQDSKHYFQCVHPMRFWIVPSMNTQMASQLLLKLLSVSEASCHAAQKLLFKKPAQPQP